jgi:hypothetical protein
LARSAEELASALRRLLFDPAERQSRIEAAERFVEEFCAHTGQDSARRIAGVILDRIGRESEVLRT